MLFVFSHNPTRKKPAGGCFAPIGWLFDLNNLGLMIATNKTPSSNTGLNSHKGSPSGFTVRLDWLQLRLIYTSIDQLQPICDRIDSMFDDRMAIDFDLPGFNGRRFDFTGKSIRGAILHCDHPTEASPGVALLVLPGRLLKLASMEQLHEFGIWLLANHSAVATRLDIALDDLTKGLSLADISQAAQDENYALVRSTEYHRRRRSRGEPWGESLVFGSPQSDKRVIFYDKEIESDGEIPSIRMEVRLRHNRANVVFREFSSLELGKVSSYLVDILTGTVDFLDRTSGDKNLERLPRLSFWQLFLDRLLSSPVRIPSKKREISFEKSLNWLEYSVAPTLSIMRKVLGIAGFHDFFNNIVKDANNRMTSHHEKIIQVYKSDLERTPIPV